MGFPGQPTTRLASFIMVENRNICLTRGKKEDIQNDPSTGSETHSYAARQVHVSDVPDPGTDWRLLSSSACVTALCRLYFCSQRCSRPGHSSIPASGPCSEPGYEFQVQTQPPGLFIPCLFLLFLEITAVYYGHTKPF